MAKEICILEGSRITSLEEFYFEFGRVVLRAPRWRGNLDAVDDILCGGFGTPDEGIVLHWKDSHLSREHLGDELFEELVDILGSHSRPEYNNTHTVDFQLR